MTRLTPTQLVILSAASQREDRGVEVPANVQGKAAGKIVDKLIRAGLLEEVRASGSLPVWRRDDESGAIALRITSAGLVAIHAAANVLLSPEAEAYFAKKGCKVLLQPTPDAIHVFNRSHGKKIGLFHVTC